jgi:hypothetical protein
MPAKKSAKSKHKYQILVNRQQSYQFEVEAESAEKACQKLQRQLQAEDTMQTESEQKPLFYRWSDPKEPREEWAIMRSTPSEAGNFLLLQAWDGNHFLTMGEGKVGDDIVQAMRKIVDPRAKKDKPKKAKTGS